MMGDHYHSMLMDCHPMTDDCYHSMMDVHYYSMMGRDYYSTVTNHRPTMANPKYYKH